MDWGYEDLRGWEKSIFLFWDDEGEDGGDFGGSNESDKAYGRAKFLRMLKEEAISAKPTICIKVLFSQTLIF